MIANHKVKGNIQLSFICCLFLGIAFILELHRRTNYYQYLSHSLSEFYRSDRIGKDPSKGINYLIQLFNQYYAVRIFQESIVEPIARDNEYDWLRNVLIQVNLRMTSQRSIMHAPSKIPDFVLGLGYCDQINSVAAQVISKYVHAAEVFSLRLPNGRSPHSIARIKFAADDPWLYLDIWSEYIVAFRKDEGFPISIVFSQRVIFDGTDDSYIERLKEIYNAGVDQGFTLSVTRKNFFEQVINKMGIKLGLHQLHQPLFFPKDQEYKNFSSANYARSLEENLFADIAPPYVEHLIDDRIAKDFFYARVKLISGANYEALEMFEAIFEKVSSYENIIPETVAVISSNIFKAHQLLILENNYYD